MNDPFAVLGLVPRFDLDEREIEARYRELQKALHPDRFVHASPQERRLSLSRAVEVNEAYRVVRDDLARGKALLDLRGHVLVERQPADPDFLMEVMEAREALSEARSEPAEVARLGARMREKAARERARIATLFNEGAAPQTIEDALSRLRYYRRFLDEIDAIEST